MTAAWTALRADDSSAKGVTHRQWIGLALGLAGLALVVWRKLGSGEMTAGNLALGIFALLCITAGALYQKRHVKPCDVRTASAIQLGAALAVSLPIAWLEPEHVVWHAELIGALAWSVLVLTGGGISLLFLMLRRGAASQVTSYFYLVPGITALMAWALFGEPLTLAMVAGMLLIVSGVALVVRSSSR